MFLRASSKLIWWYRDLRWTFKNKSPSHFEYCFLYCGYCVQHSFTAVFHCAKSGRIRSYSSPYFSTFGVHTEVYLRIQSEGGKIRTKLLFTTVNHVRFSTVYNVIKSANSRYHIRWVFPSMHCTTSITRDFSQAQAFFCHHQVCFLILELSFILHFLLRILIFYQDHHFLLEAHLLRILNMCPHQLNFVFFLWLCSIQSYWASQSSIY